MTNEELIEMLKQYPLDAKILDYEYCRNLTVEDIIYDMNDNTITIG